MSISYRKLLWLAFHTTETGMQFFFKLLLFLFFVYVSTVAFFLLFKKYILILHVCMSFDIFCSSWQIQTRIEKKLSKKEKNAKLREIV